MIVEAQTPVGVTIAFEDGEPDESGQAKRRCYRVNGEKLPSVTTVTGQFEKPGLQWAAEKLTVAGCVALAHDGELPLDVMGCLSRLRARGLRFRQIWDRKAERGHLAHGDLVAYATGGELPDILSVPPEERGFLQGVAAFQSDHAPEVLYSELIVASPRYGFAGRLDSLLRLRGRDGVGLLDLKTTESIPRYADGSPKPPYLENILQVSGYHMAAIESGYPAADWAAVLRVEASGEYVLTEIPIMHSAFLRALAVYNVNLDLTQRARGMAKAQAMAT